MAVYDYDLNENGEWVEVTILARRYSTANKQHRCDNCPSVIDVGHQYVREFLVSAGVPTTLKRHLTCPDLVREHCEGVAI